MGFLLLAPDFLLIVSGALLRRHARFPAEFWAGVEYLASAALPLGLLAVGAGLRFGGRALPPAALAWWTGVKLIAMPACAWLLATLAELPTPAFEIAVMMAAVPTASSAYILASQMNGRGAPVAMLISTGTLFAGITLPLWLAAVT